MSDAQTIVTGAWLLPVGALVVWICAILDRARQQSRGAAVALMVQIHYARAEIIAGTMAANVRARALRHELPECACAQIRSEVACFSQRNAEHLGELDAIEAMLARRTGLRLFYPPASMTGGMEIRN